MSLTVKQRSFLRAYSRTGTILGASRALGVGRQNHYDWLPDPEYKAAFDAAHEESIQRLEAELIRRAEEGEPEILMYQGAPVLEPKFDADGNVVRNKRTGKIQYSGKPMVVKKKSDLLLMFALKAARPDRYRDTSKVELGGAAGEPIQIQIRFVPPPGQAS